MAGCCPCSAKVASQGNRLPLICLVPRDRSGKSEKRADVDRSHAKPAEPASTPLNDFPLLDDEYIKKHFKLPPRALYLDPFRRPLITFPMTQEIVNHFNLARKTKINQQILDGYLDPSEAISAPSVFPYAQTKTDKSKSKEENEEIIYILQLPDWEVKCPVHQQTVKTPRFIWHSCKKSEKKEAGQELKRGGGPLHKPKPWLLSRHTDFDLLSQCSGPLKLDIRLDETGQVSSYDIKIYSDEMGRNMGLLLNDKSIGKLVSNHCMPGETYSQTTGMDDISVVVEVYKSDPALQLLKNYPITSQVITESVT